MTILRRTAPPLVLIMLWQGAAWTAQTPMLPGPWMVLTTLLADTIHGPLLSHLGITLIRVGICFVLALGIGGCLGLSMGLCPSLDRWLDPWLQGLLAIPAMVIAILAYVWLGLGEAAAVTAVTLAKIPAVAVIMREGARRRDRDLWDMAALYRFSRWMMVRHVMIPELAPYLLAAVRTGLSMVWKIVLMVELLGRSSGIGFQLHLYFQLMNITQILAYSASFMLVMAMVEIGILRWADKSVARRDRSPS